MIGIIRSFFVELRHVLLDRWAGRMLSVLVSVVGLLGLGLLFEIASAPPPTLTYTAVWQVASHSLVVQFLTGAVVVALVAALAAVFTAYSRLAAGHAAGRDVGQGHASRGAGEPLPAANAGSLAPPAARAAEPSRTPVEIGFLSLRAADLASIEAALERYGSNWPKDLPIAWPEASARLVSDLRNAIALVDRHASSEEGVDSFRVGANDVQASLGLRVPRAPAQLARFVHRIKDLGHWRARAIERYLVRKHYSLFEPAAYLLSWEGLRAFDLDMPEEWRPLFEGRPMDWKANALHPGQDVIVSWVVAVDGHKIDEVLIDLPRKLARRKGPGFIIEREAFALWAAPQLQLLEDGGRFSEKKLPDAYSEEPRLSIRKACISGTDIEV
jgi:hypothetical protein